MANPGGTPENLLPGGVPGNAGGTGRPPNELRLKNRQLHEKALAKAEERIDANEHTEAFLGTVLNATGKYGLGEAKVVVPEELIAAVADALADDDRIPTECIAGVTARLAEKLRDA